MNLNGLTTRNSKRRPFNDETNLKVKKPPKQTSVPYTTSAIKTAGKPKNKMTNLHKQLDSPRATVHLVRNEKLEKLLKNSDNILNGIEVDNKIKMHLRERKIRNYKIRDSFEFDNENDKKKHVPIYLQNLKRKEYVKNKDPFKFTDEQPKKKKDDNTDSDSSLQEILNKITKKEKQALRKKIIKKNLIKKTNTKEVPVDVIKKVNTLKRRNLATSTPVAGTIINEESPQLKPASDQINTISSTEVPPKHINIISNVIIPPLQSAPSPAHSFDVSFVDMSDFDHHDHTIPSTPWRGDDLNLRRNPHWLALKDTSLPFYNQEMILQPELLEKTPTNTSIMKEKSYQQTHISEFISRAKDSPVKINNRSVLFDEQRFSPIRNKTRTPSKINNSSHLFDENSFSPMKNQNANNLRVKRSVLSPLNRNQLFGNVNNDLNNYTFSFTDDENKENVPRQFKNKGKSLNALPMRVSITDVKKVRKEVVEELLDDLIINTSLDHSLSVEETCDVPLRLFEDLEPVPSVERTYAPKRRRKVRIASVDDEEEEKLQEKPKKKKKHLRSKAEDQEFDKWAANFNAMCEEVERHHLEIEPT